MLNPPMVSRCAVWVVLVCVFWSKGGLLAQTSVAPAGIPAAARSDSFETKMKLLQEAWDRKDFDLVRSLTHSLRDTAVQTQTEEQAPPKSVIETSHWRTVESYGPSIAKWARGWKYAKELQVQESAGDARVSEPIEMTLSFPADQVESLAREIRLARYVDGTLTELPCQVFHEVRRDHERVGSILFLCDSRPKEQQRLLVFYGNPHAELPEYPSDLKTEGEGFGLDISNAFFKASLSRQTGQLERLTLQREHGLEMFSGGKGHGEPPGIDWAHDYVDAGNFQKMRISLWEKCPDYEVIRGPLCTIVRRWGFPYSPVHPVYTPSRLKIDVEYRFYTGLPWFHKFGSMKAIQDLEAEALRDDEWVFSGQSFNHSLWMGRDGKLKTGDVDAEHQTDLWGVGFYHDVSRDSFMALFLEHQATGLPELKHTGVPLPFYRWHGAVWSRYPLPVKRVPKGAELRQKNAYVSIPFTLKDGAPVIEQLRRCLMTPLSVSEGSTTDKGSVDHVPTSGQLARTGEAGDLTLKTAIWSALRDCKDAQLYTADINVVELGLVNDVRVRGDVVTLVMSMPHRGRPVLGYFVDGSISVHPTLSVPVRERVMKVPGVRQVVVEQTWEPGWNSNRLTPEGRKKLGLD
ncbi:metal-sulfur cluster assembly factor [Schlesneria paludicola]|uniref:metal-sulfur cluster assembly factor n=1 Tax=Schlesneria paludicola TaxID=360056 RepID=UPI00029B3EEA|nr:hypothetical protein [Schlesneria paludicola]